VPLFPPGTLVTVVVDGRPIVGYAPAYLAGGRVFLPVAPLLTRLADRLWLDGDTLVIERGGRRVRVRVGPSDSGQLSAVYVPAGPVLRRLGVLVRYDPAGRRLVLSIPARASVASPAPFNPTLPSVAPGTVFTPMPVATPRPIWTGSPLARRTALPLPPPHGSGTRTTLPGTPFSTRSYASRARSSGKRAAIGDGLRLLDSKKHPNCS